MVVDWARSNGLTLNSAKTKILIIGSEAYTRELDPLTIPRVVIDGCVLPYMTEARSLGVNIHQHSKLKSACKSCYSQGLCLSIYPALLPPCPVEGR